MSGSVLHKTIRQYLLVSAALYSSLYPKPAAYRHFADNASISPPRNARKIIGFIKGTIASDEHISYLPHKRRSAKYCRLA